MTNWIKKWLKTEKLVLQVRDCTFGFVKVSEQSLVSQHRSALLVSEAQVC